MEFISQTHSKVESIFGIYKDSIFGVAYLLTESEEIFFKRLCELLKDEDYIICPKVRVGDLIEVPKKRWGRFFGKIGRPWVVSGKLDRSHVDFVLIGKRNSYIKFVLELDDPSHNSLEAHYHDRVKNEAFEQAKIPMRRFQSHYVTKKDIIERGILEK